LICSVGSDCHFEGGCNGVGIGMLPASIDSAGMEAAIESRSIEVAAVEVA